MRTAVQAAVDVSILVPTVDEIIQEVKQTFRRVRAWASLSGAMASSVRDQIEQEEPFSEAPPSGVEFAVPRWLRLLMFFVFLAVFIGALGLLAGYLALEKQSWEPARTRYRQDYLFFSPRCNCLPAPMGTVYNENKKDWTHRV